ncbi:TrbI/VirB10 family protein [Sphingopyxis sp. JAI128]|uniref:TrbI/VirB10 family protein n=1 Tax=Sphingopyxis sp. JAI128 TaxID=2723066 RepID=UPI001801689E|nr:TrbI/VirB10 family protein [Sphingopyxis sp. JAI128]MBB6428182.1 type IV secretion system protein VirB10 [Sphingopyxis sp. JAI128]
MSAPAADPAPPEAPAERGALPEVARPRAGLSGAAIAIGAGAAALLLFSVLDSRRRALSAPAVRPARADLIGVSQAPPPLFIPPIPRAAATPPLVPPSSPVAVVEVQPPRPAPGPPDISYAPAPPPAYLPTPEPAPPPRTSSGPILVVDTQARLAAEGAPTSGAANGQSAAQPGTAARSRAGSIANRATTVPQGTLIPAVLETAMNSTGAGFARALVQRDVHGFDGTRVLIPRGSRLIGEYASDTSPGQKRAFVTWTRLIRPDGVTIALQSPATDPVGVGGVRAKVNSHFFERFAGSILQTAMLIGGNLATRSVGDSVVIALPGSLPGAGATTQATQIPPTLSVRQGTSISVFVARDLDFTGVEAGR